MICKFCGNKLDTDSLYCRQCGESIRESVVQRGIGYDVPLNVILNMTPDERQKLAEAHRPESGDCGLNVYWYFDKDSATMTVWGEGMMNNCNELYSSSQWPYSKEIKRAVIKKGVTSIGDESFLECSNLTDIEIADTVTYIGKKAFSGCANLKQIILPESVEEIGEKAFEDCRALRTITIPQSVKRMGFNALLNCNFENGGIVNLSSLSGDGERVTDWGADVGEKIVDDKFVI